MGLERCWRQIYCAGYISETQMSPFKDTGWSRTREHACALSRALENEKRRRGRATQTASVNLQLLPANDIQLIITEESDSDAHRTTAGRHGSDAYKHGCCSLDEGIISRGGHTLGH